MPDNDEAFNHLCPPNRKKEQKERADLRNNKAITDTDLNIKLKKKDINSIMMLVLVARVLVPK